MRSELSGLVAVEVVVGVAGVHGEHGYRCAVVSGLRPAAASPLVSAAVTNYCAMPHGEPDFAKIDRAVLGHFGIADEFASVEDAWALETELGAAGVDVRVLRGRPTRLLQRHPPARHPPRRGGGEVVGPHVGLPARALRGGD